MAALGSDSADTIPGTTPARAGWALASLCVFWTRVVKCDAFMKSRNYLLNFTDNSGFD